MATTPNLGITHIESNQSQKEVTANEAFDTLDEALAGELTHNMASDANYTLDVTEPAKEDENLVIHITDTGVVLTTTRDIIFPDKAQLHVAYNDTAQSLRFKTASGAAYTVAAGGIRLFYIEGASPYDAFAVADDGAASNPDFTDLGDTPGTYTGDGGKVVKVKGAEDGLEFVTESAATGVYWATPHKGALVDLASDITSVNATAGYTVVWDTEVRDTDSFVDLGTNATRITVPAGFSLARLSAGLFIDSITADVGVLLRINKNGTTVQEHRSDSKGGFTNFGIQTNTPVLSVSATDYFEAELWVQTDTNVTVKADSWFQLEVMEASTAENPPYDIGLFFSGKPTNSQEIFRMEATRAFTIPDGATGSNALARVASTGNVSFSFRRNGVEFATASFNASTAGAWSQTGDEAFSEDDDLTIIAPATADSTLADISFMLKGTRSG